MPLITYIPFLLIWFLSMMLPSSVSGHNMVNTEDLPHGRISMTAWAPCPSLAKHKQTRIHKEVRKQHREEKFIARFQKIVQAKFQRKHPGGISDPIDRWFWIWTIGWGLGIIMTIIAGGAIASTALGIVWLASFVIGSVALILWLVKKFGQ
jgi:hypothetical protein